MLPSIKDYTLREMIAEGKHTMIFRAEKKSDQQPVVIKLLKTESIIPKNVEQLTHEYDMLTKLHSNHVVKAYELLPIQNSLLLVMEDSQAQTLATLIDEDDLDLLTSLEIAVRIADAVGDIHHQHIIHKDLKPQNILVNKEQGQVKVIDFGIATQLSREVQQTLNPEQVEGSLAYVSPEQTGRMNRPLDYRTDIYSLGVTLYQLFTKKLPFEADSPLELLHLHIAQQPIPPSDINPTLPKVISDIILKCMSKEAEHRYHSAFGLKYDLEKCRQLLLEKSEIPEFQIGERDVFDHYHIPEKLFGRQKELNFINQCYNEVWGGDTILLTISGYSGIGKSSLVFEAQKNIASKNGRFVNAKYDQFKRNIPYSGLIQAFQGLINQLLSEPDEILQEWKERLLEAVGTNGQVIVDVIPEIKLIIGDQSPIEKLSPQDNANRFNYVLTNFLKAFLHPDKPLVLFIDDFQWADEPSLKLLELFFGDQSVKNLLFIMAYRDNEVAPFHPLQIALREIAAQGGKVANLSVKALSQQAVQELIQDAFYGPPKQTEELAGLLFRKAEGNPFFTLQLLKLLYEEDLFYFDKERGCWMAKLDAIKRVKVSENVADLLINKLTSLPGDVLRVLTVGSAMESRFVPEIVAKVSGLQKEKVINLLTLAQQGDLIIQERLNKTGVKGEDDSTTAYRFLHDRIQQGAYALINDTEKKKLHYEIGKALLEGVSEDKLNEKCIDIVNHFNLGDLKSLSASEKELLVRLNLMAGLKTKESVAYIPAIQYFTKGIELLPEKSWDNNHDLAMELHHNLAMCLSISGGAKQAETHFDLCLEKARSNYEKARIYRDLIILNSQLQNYEKCFALAVKALKLFNWDYDIHPSKLSLILHLIKLKFKTKFQKIEDLENKPLVSDQKFPLFFEIFQAITYPAFVTGNKTLFLKNALSIIDLSMDQGVSRPTPVGLATYGMVLGSEMLHDYETSSLYGKTALNLAQRFPKTIEKGGATYMYYAFIHRWKNHLRTSVLPLRQNFRLLLEQGGGPIAAADGVYINLISLVTGDKLDNVLESIIETLQEIKKFSSASEEFSAMVHREVCACLKGLTQDPTDPRPSELTDELINATSTNQNLLYLLRYDVWHMVLLYLFGRYDEAIGIGKRVLTKTDNYPNWIEWHIYYFFYSLTLAATLKSPKDKPEAWKQLLQNYKKLQRWAKASPINYAHYEKIIRAEMERIQNNEKAVSFYEDAVKAAKKSECTQDVAIAYELLGKYYKSKDLAEMTSIFFHKALQYFAQWGADAKCLHFKNEYAEFLTLETLSLSPFSMQDMPFLTTTAHSRTTVSTSTASQTGSTRKTNSRSTGEGGDFDIDALIDASQALSKEIVLEKLMESLMQVVIVNAGADKVFLILFENKKAFIHSQIFLNQKYTPLLSPIPIELKNEELSTAIIKYVTRTNTELLLNNAPEEGNFRYDPYVLNKKPKSILCLPLIQKGSLTGVLYLENNAIKGAFTPKRMRLLTLLSSQMAISIENAQFYAKLESKVQERTKELQQRNQELQQALQTIKNVQQQMIQQEKLASLGLLTSGIAHELKNPLNFVINFAQIAQDTIQELMEELRDKGTLPKEKLEIFSEIQQTLNKVDLHGKRADGIIKGMLMHAHQGSAQAETIDLNSLVDQALNLTYHSYRKKDAKFNLSLNKNYDDGLRQVVGYPGDLIRVFINIFDNACYALLEKTKKNLPGFLAQLDIKTERKGENAMVTIRDNGLGIPKIVLDKIFQPFFTTKPTGSGTGLGLSIVYDIVTKQHGGSIQVRSEPDEYTEFTLMLPLKEDQASP